MRRSSFVLCLAALLGAACSSSTAGTDLGVVEPGCRAPSACYKVGADCDCNRADVESACKSCDPRAMDCVCDSTSRCLEASQVCVGRAPAPCLGSGAICVPAGATCASGPGTPPQLVGTGVGGALEPRCTFTDDVCCPGVVIDLGQVD